MAPFRHRLLGVLISAKLCNGIPWNWGATMTAVERQESTPVGILSGSPKPTMFSFVMSAIDICGYESGQAQSPIGCGTGKICDISSLAAGTIDPYLLPLIMGCCIPSSSCAIPTSCVDLSVTAPSDTNVLSCGQVAPYCQSITFPEQRAFMYSCGDIPDSTWRTISLSYTSSETLFNSSGIISTNTPLSSSSGSIQETTSLPPTTTAPNLSVSGSIQEIPTTTPAPASPSASSGSIQDLTLGQKFGIATGSGGAFILFTAGIFWRHQIRKRASSPTVTPIDEKSPTPQVTEIRDQEGITE